MSLVTSAEARTHLGITGYDDFLTAAITQVTAAVESYTGRSFTAEAEVIDVVDGGGECLVLSSPPVADLTEVLDRDSEEALTLTDLDLNASAGLIYWLDRSSFSSGKRRYQVTYDSGYASVPNDVKLAALTWVAEIFANRPSAKSEQLGDHQVSWAGILNAIGMPDRVKLLLSKYRDISI